MESFTSARGTIPCMRLTPSRVICSGKRPRASPLNRRPQWLMECSTLAPMTRKCTLSRYPVPYHEKLWIKNIVFPLYITAARIYTHGQFILHQKKRNHEYFPGVVPCEYYL